MKRFEFVSPSSQSNPQKAVFGIKFKGDMASESVNFSRWYSV